MLEITTRPPNSFIHSNRNHSSFLDNNRAQGNINNHQIVNVKQRSSSLHNNSNNNEDDYINFLDNFIGNNNANNRTYSTNSYFVPKSPILPHMPIIPNVPRNFVTRILSNKNNSNINKKNNYNNLMSSSASDLKPKPEKEIISDDFINNGTYSDFAIVKKNINPKYKPNMVTILPVYYETTESVLNSTKIPLIKTNNNTNIISNSAIEGVGSALSAINDHNNLNFQYNTGNRQQSYMIPINNEQSIYELPVKITQKNSQKKSMIKEHDIMLKDRLIDIPGRFCNSASNHNTYQTSPKTVSKANSLNKMEYQKYLITGANDKTNDSNNNDYHNYWVPTLKSDLLTLPKLYRSSMNNLNSNSLFEKNPSNSFFIANPLLNESNGYTSTIIESKPQKIHKSILVNGHKRNGKQSNVSITPKMPKKTVTFAKDIR